MNFIVLSGSELLRLVLSLVASYLLSLPVGWERKRHSHAYVGLRVFPLVAVGACVYIFIGQQLFTGEHEAEQSQLLQGLMTGIGFIGAGAIIKQAHDVRGVATAASIWTTGAIGASVAYGYIFVAVSLSLINLVILNVTWRLAARAEEALKSETDHSGKA